MKKIRQILIDKINKSEWWHVTPRDPDAYSKRGKFLASTYLQAAFYGRPNDIPERVAIVNPVYGSEEEVMKKLFPKNYRKIEIKYKEKKYGYDKNWYEKIIYLEAKKFRQAKKLGYDAIVIMGSNGIDYLKKNIKPRAIELNLLYV